MYAAQEHRLLWVLWWHIACGRADLAQLAIMPQLTAASCYLQAWQKVLSLTTIDAQASAGQHICRQEGAASCSDLDTKLSVLSLEPVKFLFQLSDPSLIHRQFPIGFGCLLFWHACKGV